MSGEGESVPAQESVPELLLDRMTDAFLALDTDGRVTYLNERAETMLAPAHDPSADVEDLEGAVLWDALAKGRQTTLYDRFDEAMSDQEQVSYEDYYPPLDAWFEVRIYPSESGLSVYFRDVTDQRERRERLRRREGALRDLYEAIATTDATFQERVHSLLDIGREVLDAEYGTLSRVEGDTYHFEYVRGPDAIAPGDEVDVGATYCERVVSTEQSVEIGDVVADAPELLDRAGYTELGITCYIGAPVYVDGEVYGTLCFYGTGERAEGFTEWERTLVDLMGRWVGTAMDRQQAAERLERQNEQLERFAEILSHDLRNPLQVVRGNLEMAADDRESPELDRARDAAERIDLMITDVLSLATADEELDTTESVGLDGVSADAWDTVPTAGATLSASTGATVEADRERLMRALENLFRNCVEHAEGDPAVRVVETESGFAVCDDGPGIPPEERESVLDHGYSGSDDGTGYGLAIVSEIAEAHGWDLRVGESDSGGTCVEFVGAD
ncbi:MAG: ATP-binding protein [Halobacteriaceae archaeon]